jgi:hypothetical protein
VHIHFLPACSFDWELNPQTGVPVELINVFSPNYDNSSLPDSERVKGEQRARARVYYVDKSRADDKPAWRFDHGGAGRHVRLVFLLGF